MAIQGVSSVNSAAAATAKNVSFKAAQAKPEGKNTNYKKLAIAAAAITAAGIAALILIKKGKKPQIKHFNYMDGINKINKDIADTAARTSEKGVSQKAADLAAAFGGEAVHVPQKSSIIAKAAPQADSRIPMVMVQAEPEVLSYLPVAPDVPNKIVNAGKKAANVSKKAAQKAMQAAKKAEKEAAQILEKKRGNIPQLLQTAESTGFSRINKLAEFSKNLKEGQSLSDIAELSKAVQNETGLSKTEAVKNLIDGYLK